MTARATLPVDPAALSSVRPSARVRTVADILDCDESQVRRLILAKKLETHGLGKRGLRVYLDSVRDYQAGKEPAPKPKSVPSKAGRAAHLHAMAELRARGIV